MSAARKAAARRLGLMSAGFFTCCFNLLLYWLLVLLYWLRHALPQQALAKQAVKQVQVCICHICYMSVCLCVWNGLAFHLLHVSVACVASATSAACMCVCVPGMVQHFGWLCSNAFELFRTRKGREQAFELVKTMVCRNIVLVVLTHPLCRQ
jgi:hypothetical protein